MEIKLTDQQNEFLQSFLEGVRKANTGPAAAVLSSMILKKLQGIEDPTCRFEHECTSGCGNDYDCPCQSEHCCAMSYEGLCGGKDDCEDHYEKKEKKIKQEIVNEDRTN